MKYLALGRNVGQHIYQSVSGIIRSFIQYNLSFNRTCDHSGERPKRPLTLRARTDSWIRPYYNSTSGKSRALDGMIAQSLNQPITFYVASSFTQLLTQSRSLKHSSLVGWLRRKLPSLHRPLSERAGHERQLNWAVRLQKSNGCKSSVLWNNAHQLEANCACNL